ncbi:ribosomal protein S18-alanine N-acetyltransferase [Neptuniibacter sp. 2_MG-2023]|uniref:ribosomal protein S18-alanine N-acetyltransferase n=1 Tax=Neptuniibacter sp. 2_MG-2023 TaxID=3062671 RepID=UPI0026E24BCB|nr:ribosomal protein S18-alanine N-acetyltransferase [Neptuniibacter sp. 2_MG-2023]MDO6514771.1 ribosomal protein S18-alanine N-acetyltransferase [Neptuniibacter sp. 2_MG-2023]
MAIIQPLTAANLSALIQLENECFVGGWSQTQLVRQLEHPRGISLGIFAPDLVGFILLSTLLDEAELLQIAVDSQHRGEGLGQQLLAACMPLLEEQQIKRLMLEVRESNLVARSLYNSFGFIEEGRRKGYYVSLESPTVREDALLLSLML